MCVLDFSYQYDYVVLCPLDGSFNIKFSTWIFHVSASLLNHFSSLFLAGGIFGLYDGKIKETLLSTASSNQVQDYRTVLPE